MDPQQYLDHGWALLDAGDATKALLWFGRARELQPVGWEFKHKHVPMPVLACLGAGTAFLRLQRQGDATEQFFWARQLAVPSRDALLPALAAWIAVKALALEIALYLDKGELGWAYQRARVLHPANLAPGQDIPRDDLDWFTYVALWTATMMQAPEARPEERQSAIDYLRSSNESMGGALGMVSAAWVAQHSIGDSMLIAQAIQTWFATVKSHPTWTIQIPRHPLAYFYVFSVR